MNLLMLNVTSAITLLTACLTFSAVKNSQGIAISKILEYSKFNLTKRPLNLYITANGKHAIVNNRTLDFAKISGTANASFNNNSTAAPQKSLEFTDYRIAQPPFSIKKRGSVILLHNAGNSISWHRGHPSLIQMLAASGHTTVSIELVNDKVTNVKRIRQIISIEKLQNITFISSEDSSEAILLDLLSKNSQPATNVEHVKQITQLTDGVVLISVPKFEEKWKKLFELTPDSNKKSAVAILFVRYNQQKSNAKSVDTASVSSSIKRVNFDKKTNAKNDIDSKGQEYSNTIMQVLANYLDFIHPR